MLTVHHVNAFLVIGVCLAASAAAVRRAAARRRAGCHATCSRSPRRSSSRRCCSACCCWPTTAVRPTSCTTPTGRSRCSRVFAPWLYAPRDPRARLAVVRGRDAGRRRARRACLHDCNMIRISPFVRGMLILAVIALVDRRAEPGDVALDRGALRSASRSSSRSRSSSTCSGATSAAARSRSGRSGSQWVFYGAVGLVVADIGWCVLGGPSDGARRARVLRRRSPCAIFVGVRTWREQHRYS